MELKGKKILFLGDSITEGARTSGKAARFSSLIQESEGADCVNYGIGGTRIAYQNKPSENARWDLNFVDRVDEMDSETDFVVVFGGTNDYGHGDAAIGTFEDRTPETFYGAMHTLCSKLIAKYPTADIVFLTPLHRAVESQERIKGGVNTFVTLEQYINVMREVLAYYAIPVLDLYKEGKLQPQVPAIKEMYVPDGLHPNDEGHKILAQKITAFLKSHF